MPKLLALAAEDAYAFAEQNDELFLIRPPFTSRVKKQVPRAALETAIVRYGFMRSDQTFDSWSGLVQYLRDEFLRARRGTNQQPEDSDNIRRLVQRAPEEVVLQYLERIETELIPREEWSAAIELLTHLFRNVVAKGRPDLLDNCATLLERCETLRRARESFLTNCGDLITQQVDDGTESGWPVELGRRVRACGQLLLVGSAD
jgi:hypothetical protein